MILDHFSQGHVERFNGVGGGDGSTDLLREGKERNHSHPVVHPGTADSGILLGDCKVVCVKGSEV